MNAIIHQLTDIHPFFGPLAAILLCGWIALLGIAFSLLVATASNALVQILFERNQTPNQEINMKGRFTLVALLAIAFTLTGCESIKSMVNLGDGKLLGVVSYEIPETILPNGTTIEAGSSITDVLVQMGINLAAEAMKDKWNVEDVVQDVDSEGNTVTKVITEYGTFVLATGQLADTIKSISFQEADDPDALEIVFEDADGSTQTGTISTTP